MGSNYVSPTPWSDPDPDPPVAAASGMTPRATARTQAVDRAAQLAFEAEAMERDAQQIQGIVRGRKSRANVAAMKQQLEVRENAAEKRKKEQDDIAKATTHLSLGVLIATSPGWYCTDTAQIEREDERRPQIGPKAEAPGPKWGREDARHARGVCVPPGMKHLPSAWVSLASPRIAGSSTTSQRHIRPYSATQCARS